MLKTSRTGFAIAFFAACAGTVIAQDEDGEEPVYVPVSFDAPANDYAGIYVRDQPAIYAGTLIHLQETAPGSGTYRGTVVEPSAAEASQTSISRSSRLVELSIGDGIQKIRADRYGPADRFPQFSFTGTVAWFSSHPYFPTCDNVEAYTFQPVSTTALGENVVHSFAGHSPVVEYDADACTRREIPVNEPSDMHFFSFHRVGMVRSVAFVTATAPFTSLVTAPLGEAFRIRVEYAPEPGRGEPVPDTGLVFLDIIDPSGESSMGSGLVVQHHDGQDAHYSQPFHLGYTDPTEARTDIDEVELTVLAGTDFRVRAGRSSATLAVTDRGTSPSLKLDLTGTDPCLPGNPCDSGAFYIVNDGDAPIEGIELEFLDPELARTLVRAFTSGCDADGSECQPSPCDVDASTVTCGEAPALKPGERRKILYTMGSPMTNAQPIPDACPGGEVKLRATGSAAAGGPVVSAPVTLCIGSETLGPKILLSEIYTPEVESNGRIDVGTFSVRTEYARGAYGSPTLSLRAGDGELAVPLEKGRSTQGTNYFSGPVRVQFIPGEPFLVYSPPQYNDDRIDPQHPGIGTGRLTPDPATLPNVRFSGEPPMSGKDGSPVQLALSSLPPHRSLELSFDLDLTGAWIGSNPWSVREPGSSFAYETTFSNVPGANRSLWGQAYPGALPAANKANAAYTGAKMLSELAAALKANPDRTRARIFEGTPIRYVDETTGRTVESSYLWTDVVATYGLDLSLPHSASSATLVFGSTFRVGYAGKYGRRSWSVRGLRVRATAAPPRELRFIDAESGARARDDDEVKALVIEARFDAAFPAARPVTVMLAHAGKTLPVTLAATDARRTVFRSGRIEIFPGNVTEAPGEAR